MKDMVYTVYGLHLGDYVFRYIGVTRVSVEERLKSHFGDIHRNRNPHKCNWLKLHRDKVQINVIHDSIENIEEAETWEKFYIKKYEENRLLNKNEGGSLLPKSKQSTRPWNTGIPCTYKDKLIQNSPRSKKVYQYDLEGNFMKEYRSIKFASLSTGCARASILNCARLIQLRNKNFRWRFFKQDKIEKYTPPDDSIRLAKVRATRLRNLKMVKITDNQTGEILTFNNVSEAALALNLKPSTIFTYCGANKKTKKYDYEYK